MPKGIRCQRCGHTAPADEHAARNILRAGLAYTPQPRRKEAGRFQRPEKSLVLPTVLVRLSHQLGAGAMGGSMVTGGALS